MASSYSLSLSSFTLSKPKPLSHSLQSISLSSNRNAAPVAATAAALSLSLAFCSEKRLEAISSRFVRNVAVSSEVEQEEDDEGAFSGDSDANVEETEFSPDLKLFVGNLPFSVDSAQLAGLFETAGTVEMVEVIYDKATGRSRGFGFVTMSSAEEVEAAEQQFNGYVLDGRTLRVNAGPPPPKREGFVPRGGSSYENSYRVHVGNLSWGVDDMSLKSLFSDHGNVVEAKVIYDRESGRSRGFGFVTFNSAEEVDTAIQSLDGADLDGRPIRVTMAEARPPRRQF
ncbi:hypothetical protein V2J09_010576 [Rumex salicifolius]